jgi:hypothetical protein
MYTPEAKPIGMGNHVPAVNVTVSTTLVVVVVVAESYMVTVPLDDADTSMPNSLQPIGDTLPVAEICL